MADFLAPGQPGLDAFGLETPEAASARVKERFAQRRQEFFGSTASQSHGRQVGQALADIFGMPVRQALDTATARSDEQKRLIAAGSTKESARQAAKASIDPAFAEVRRAQRLQGMGIDAQASIDSLIEQGMPAASAQAVGMFQMARKLEAQGFGTEATQMRMQASEQLQAQEEREAALAKVRATTSNTEANTIKTQTELAAGDDTFVRFDDAGNIDSIMSVPLTDLDKRTEARDSGHINIGNAGIGIDVSGDALRQKGVVSNEVQENIRAQTEMLSSLDVLESVADQTGLVEGPLRGLFAKLGLAEENFIQSIAVKDKMEADIQSMIKGIPSNYDAEIFQKQIPDPTKFQSTELYKERVRLLRNNVERALELTIAFHKGTNKEFPPEVLQAMTKFGVDAETINPMTAEEVAAATASHNAIMTEQSQIIQDRDPQPDNNPEAKRQELLERARKLQQGS